MDRRSRVTEEELNDEVEALMDSNENLNETWDGTGTFGNPNDPPVHNVDMSVAGVDLGDFDSLGDAFEAFKDELGNEWRRLAIEEQQAVQVALRAIVHNTALAAAYPEKAANYKRNILMARGTLAAIQSIAADRMRLAITRAIDTAFTKLIQIAISAIVAV